MQEFLYYYSVVGIEEEGEIVLYLYNAKDDSLLPFPVGNGVDPGPDPDEPFIFDLEAYMINPANGNVSVVTDRFEVLEAQTDGNNMVFHVKTLKDKMSMQGGVFLLVPTNLSISPQVKVTGAVQINSPRRSEWTAVSGEAKWETGNVGYGLIFTIKGKEMSGSATTSQDDPWSWYYGFEIKGRIPLT